MLSIRPLTSRLYRQPLTTLASEIHVVEPECQGLRNAAIQLPGELDRIKGIQEETNLDYELNRVKGGHVNHVSTIAYRLRDAHLVEGRLFSRRGHFSLVYDPRPSIWPRSINEEIDSAAFSSSNVSDRYFGHALIDRSCTSLMAKDFAPVRHPKWRGQGHFPHLSWYEGLWNVNFPLLESALIRDAWVFQDFGMNPHRVRRMQRMRSLVHAQAVARTPRMAMILRGTSGVRRHLVNEQALADMLAARGAVIVDPIQDTSEQIARKLAGVQLVIGVEGSALAHGLLGLANHGAMLAIQPPYRFNNVFKDYTDALQLRYGFVVAEGGKDSFELDSSRLLRTIDLIQAAMHSGEQAVPT